MAEQKLIPIDTIPLPKLAVVMNNFIANTINHLNKLSVKGDEKLAEFDNKLDDLERMTTLLEAKLFSLPEKITSTYPQLEEVDLDTEITNIQLQPQPQIQQNGGNNELGITSGTGGTVPPPPPPPPPPPIGGGQQVPPIEQDESKKKEPDNGEEEKIPEKEGNEENMSPQEALDNFLKEHQDFKTIFTRLKVGAPLVAVEQNAKAQGFNMELFQELVDKAKKANMLK